MLCVGSLQLRLGLGYAYGYTTVIVRVRASRAINDRVLCGRLCGVKYEWPRSRCVSFGARIESELQAKGINDPQKQAAAALEMVIAQIKQDKASAISNLKSELEPATTSKSNQSSSRKQSKQRAPLRL